MTRVRVWAPDVEGLELVTPQRRAAMVPVEHGIGRGWWQSADDLEPDTLYRV